MWVIIALDKLESVRSSDVTMSRIPPLQQRGEGC
jgi:hypothetical protein